jgi:hypothetical protein
MPDGAGHAGDPPRGARDRGGASACGRAAGRLRRFEQQLDELDLDREGEVRERRRGRVHRARMRRLPHTRRRPQSRDGRSQPRPAQAQHGDGREARRERRRRDAGIPWTAHTRPDPRRRPVRRTKRQQLIGACQRQRLPPWTCATPAEASVWLPVSSTLAGRPRRKSRTGRVRAYLSRKAAVSSSIAGLLVLALSKRTPFGFLVAQTEWAIERRLRSG